MRQELSQMANTILRGILKSPITTKANAQLSKDAPGNSSD